jgi:hypothetical protein
MKRKQSGRFTIKARTIKSHGREYQAFELAGSLAGKRVRRQFGSREEAIGQKHLLEVEAANLGGDIRARNTRLSAEQACRSRSGY